MKSALGLTALVLFTACSGGGDPPVVPIDAPTLPDAVVTDAPVASDAPAPDAPPTPIDGRPGPDAMPDGPIGGTCSLVVERVGLGMGTVASVGSALINCGSLCRATVPCGTTITLLATPSVGSMFITWGVSCTGGGTCSLTLTQPVTSVVANFGRTP